MKWILAALLVGILADVVPSCGRRVVMRPPGGRCGGDEYGKAEECDDPGICMALENQGPLCSRFCSTDADCAKLGAGFGCDGSGRPFDKPSGGYKKVCLPQRRE
jgi:hypothetical protein